MGQKSEVGAEAAAGGGVGALETRHTQFSFGCAREDVAGAGGEGVEIKQQSVVERPSFFEYVRVYEHKTPSRNHSSARANARHQIPRVHT